VQPSRQNRVNHLELPALNAIRRCRPQRKDFAMTIAPRLRQHLDAVKADYELIEHPPTSSAMENARLCDIPAEQVAKAVLLDTTDDYLLAVLPSDRRVELAELRSELGRKPRLADEDELGRVFDDCAFGAVPPGLGYGVATIVDDSLETQPDVYFEAGDHASLIHMDGAEFGRMMRSARHGQFSEPIQD
jgi:Ala-tRNA(Pro) deacylase